MYELLNSQDFSKTPAHRSTVVRYGTRHDKVNIRVYTHKHAAAAAIFFSLSLSLFRDTRPISATLLREDIKSAIV